MWHEHMWNGPWMMGWGFIPMLVFWLLVFGAVAYLFRVLSSERGTSSGDSSLQILKDRLASGEINQEEFDALYQKLKRSQ